MSSAIPNGVCPRISLINPLGLTTTFAYSYGKLTTTTDPLGRETHYSYDSVGRMIRVTDALGGEIAYSYDPDGNRIGATDQRGNETLTSVDALSRVTSVTYPDDAVAKRDYNAVGSLVRTTDPLGNTTLFEYDAAGRQTARVDPEGERTEYEYDAAGNRTALVRAEGTALEVRDEYAYDSLGRLVTTTRAVGSDDEVTVLYGYDANGNLTSITNGRGYAWTFEYDAMNRLVAEIDPLDRTRDYSYDLAGQLVEKRDPKGQKIQYDYDNGGRVTEARYIRADDTTENTARMAYDAVGNMVEVTDTNVDISQEFDERNRITLIRHEHLDKTQRQGWDAAGNRIWMSVDEIESSTATYTWDSRNQLTQIDHDTMGTVTYTYNAAGQKISMVLPNDIDCDYTYDDNGRLTNLDYRKPDTTQVFFEDLTYDGRGNITRRVDDEGTHDYQYDDLDQLTRADYPDSTYEQFAYDVAGNRTSVTTSGGTADYTVDAADQLTQVDGPGASEITTFSWTDNGEMASQLHSSATTPTTYGWTVASSLDRVSFSSTDVTTFTYMPSRGVLGGLSSVSTSMGTTYYLPDRLSFGPLSLLNQELSATTSFMPILGSQGALAYSTASSSTTMTPIRDSRGSTRKLVGNQATFPGPFYTAFGVTRGTSLETLDSYHDSDAIADSSLRLNSRDSIFSSEFGRRIHPTPGAPVVQQWTESAAFPFNQFAYRANSPYRRSAFRYLSRDPSVYVLSWLDRRAVKGQTGCNEETGDPEPRLLGSWGDCQDRCLLQHEKIHAWDIRLACKLLVKCYMDSERAGGDVEGRKDECAAVYGKWHSENRACRECRAYRVSVPCLERARQDPACCNERDTIWDELVDELGDLNRQCRLSRSSGRPCPPPPPRY